MMNPTLSDPNNHVPEVSPDDSWGDPEERASELASGQTVLPARRVSSVPADTKEVGLHISPTLSRSEPADPSQELEVLEIKSEVVRLDIAEEAPPKVERHFTFHEKPAQEKPKSLGINIKRIGGQLRSRWMLGMAVTVTVLVISSLMILPAINAPNAPRQNSGQRLLSVVNEKKIKGAEALTRLLSQQPEALQLYRSYVQAASVDEVIPLVKDGRNLMEALRNSWKPSEFPKSWIPAADSSWSVLEIEETPCAIMEGDLPDKSRFKAYFSTQGGHLLLDWKATVGYGTASFTELEEGAGDGSEIRGVLSKAEFYSTTWPETDYQSYRLIAPDRQAMIWCYSRRGESTEAILAPLFDRGAIIGEAQSTRIITLRLAHGPQDSRPNQWLIAEMLHIDWLSPKTPNRERE